MDAQHGRQLNVWWKTLTTIKQECCELYWTSPRGNTQQNSSCTATYHSSRKLSKLDEPDMADTAGEVRLDQLEAIYNSSVPIQYVTWRTSRERWTIETGGERGSGRSVLGAQHDDDDDVEGIKVFIPFPLILESDLNNTYFEPLRHGNSPSETHESKIIRFLRDSKRIKSKVTFLFECSLISGRHYLTWVFERWISAYEFAIGNTFFSAFYKEINWDGSFNVPEDCKHDVLF